MDLDFDLDLLEKIITLLVQKLFETIRKTPGLEEGSDFTSYETAHRNYYGSGRSQVKNSLEYLLMLENRLSELVTLIEDELTEAEQDRVMKYEDALTEQDN